MQTWTIQKPQVSSAGGVVACQHYEAARVGAAVLARGGTAMDAAVVSALVLSTAEPWLSGIGGGGFLIHADPVAGQVETLDFNVRAPRGLDPADYPLTAGATGSWFEWPAVEGDRNVIGYSSICVPGTVDGLARALERHGTLSWAEALAPAIEAAERGLEVDWYTNLCLAIDAANLARNPVSAELFLEDGRPPKAPATGARRYLPFPCKAKTLRRLASAGARDFYEGGVARDLVADLCEGGSAIDSVDLAEYRAEWGTPLEGEYAGHRICTIGGLSGGPSLLQALDALDGELNRSATEAESALRYARAIRSAYEYRLNRMGHAALGEDCTTHISVVDRAGRMVSLTNTLLSRFGSKVALPRTGFLLNNGMMWFDPRPGSPNAICPGARPLANMAPTILMEGDRPVMALGAAGGRQIFPTIAQLISYRLDFGIGLEEAFHRPRIDASTPTIRIDRQAAPGVAAHVAREFPVEIVSDTLYPVNFAIPSAVERDWAARRNTGMAHPTSPWAFVASEERPEAEERVDA